MIYYELPVYKASYQLLKMVFGVSSKFAREHKYTTGQELKKECTALIKNIYRANKVVDKTVAINEARENVEIIRLYVRIMHDFNQLNFKRYCLVEIF